MAKKEDAAVRRVMLRLGGEKHFNCRPDEDGMKIIDLCVDGKKREAYEELKKALRWIKPWNVAPGLIAYILLHRDWSKISVLAQSLRDDPHTEYEKVIEIFLYCIHYLHKEELALSGNPSSHLADLLEKGWLRPTPVEKHEEGMLRDYVPALVEEYAKLRSIGIMKDIWVIGDRRGEPNGLCKALLEQFTVKYYLSLGIMGKIGALC